MVKASLIIFKNLFVNVEYANPAVIIDL